MSAPSNRVELCPNCGEFTEYLNSITGWCQNCSPVAKKQLEIWLSQNADAIEHFLTQGKSLSKAVDLVKATKPTCLCCGGVIHRAPKRSVVFCRRTPQCKRYSRRYVYLYRERGLTKAEALAQIINELS